MPRQAKMFHHPNHQPPICNFEASIASAVNEIWNPSRNETTVKNIYIA
jgi:hypothetical protein